MRKRSLILIPFLLILLTLSSCQEETGPPMTKAMSEQLALMPADAGAMAYMNMKQFRESDFFSMLNDSTGHWFDNEDYQELIDETGIDLRTSINELYLAMNIDDSPKPHNVLAVLKIDYDPQKLQSFIEKQDDRNELGQESYQDHSIYVMTKENAMGLCLLDNKTIVGGNLAEVKAYLDRLATGVSDTENVRLTSLVKNLQYKNGMWFVMETSELLKKTAKDKMGRFSGIKSLQQLSFSTEFTDAIHMEGLGRFDTEQNAGLFYDAVKGALSATKLSMSDDRKAVDILNKFELNTKGSDMRMHFSISKEEFEKLLNKRHNLAAEII